MSDVITQLYLGIDRFSYLGNELKISKDDIRVLNKSWNDLKYKPGLFLIFTIAISRNRLLLWNLIKFKIRGDRVALSSADYKSNFAPVIERSTQSTVNPNNVAFENTYSSVELTGTSSRVSRRRREKVEDEKVTLPRRNPTFSEEYFKNAGTITKNVKDMRLRNTLVSWLRTDRVSFINRSEKYFMKTRLIYFPFILVFMLYFSDFMITSLGLYFKYQPLVDQYYLNNIKT
jgi:hypothetical protein